MFELRKKVPDVSFWRLYAEKGNNTVHAEPVGVYSVVPDPLEGIAWSANDVI